MSTNQNQKESLRIVVDEPEEFRGILRSDITTTEKLAKKINKLFNPVFSDYVGCSIVPNQVGILQVSLFFKDEGPQRDDRYKAFVPVGTAINKDASIVQKLNVMNRRSSSRKYEMTEEARELLSEFFITAPNKDVNWNQVTLEEVEQTNVGLGIYSKIIGMDLNRLVKKIFGGKVDSSRVDYQITSIKPISAGIPGMTNLALNWMISIQQLDINLVNQLATEAGVIPTTGKIPMIVGI